MVLGVVVDRIVSLVMALAGNSLECDMSIEGVRPVPVSKIVIDTFQ